MGLALSSSSESNWIGGGTTVFFFLLPADRELALGRLGCAFGPDVFPAPRAVLFLAFFAPVVVAVTAGGAGGPAGVA